MFPPFFNATSTARVLSLLLHFLKQIFSGPHFQNIAYQPKAASRSAAGKAAKRDSITVSYTHLTLPTILQV